ncbi:hypothetical protein HDU80_002408, partial [Chytriomyces hyalinus]
MNILTDSADMLSVVNYMITQVIQNLENQVAARDETIRQLREHAQAPHTCQQNQPLHTQSNTITSIPNIIPISSTSTAGSSSISTSIATSNIFTAPIDAATTSSRTSTVTQNDHARPTTMSNFSSNPTAAPGQGNGKGK